VAQYFSQYCLCDCVYRELYKKGEFVEAYKYGSEAMKIHSGHEGANKLVRKIRDIVCKFAISFTGGTV